MNFIYGCDGLGDKLECGKYLIRPVLYTDGYAEPSTFEDFDRYALYFITKFGISTHIDDFDTVAEAISGASNHED